MPRSIAIALIGGIIILLGAFTLIAKIIGGVILCVGILSAGMELDKLWEAFDEKPIDLG